MKSLPIPNGDHFATFQVLARDRPAMEALTNEIEDRYDNYQQNRERLETVPAVEHSQAVEDTFKSAYTSLRNRLNKEMNEDVAEAELCPYCLIHCARDWDHFLPQITFPDFAVYRPNLLRVCTGCNRKKGNRFVTQPRKALNPYFDQIDAVPFLKCEVDTDHPLTAIFRAEPPAGTEPYYANLIQRHFKAYDLARKYRAQATDQLTKFVRGILYEVMHGVELSQNLINRESDKLIYVEDVAPNYWRSALARGLRVSPGLYEYIQNQIGVVGASYVA